MTVIGFLIGLAIFLIIGYICLMLVIVPYIWFSDSLELDERKAKESRDAYQKKMQELENRNDIDTSRITPLKNPKPRGIRRLIENELVIESLEELFGWGVFLALEGVWVYSLYNGFEFVMQNVSDFLDNNFFTE